MRKMKEGVKYSKSKNSWISVFTDNNGKYHELYFSVSRYGDDTQRIAEQCFNLKRDIRKNEYIFHEDYIEIIIIRKDEKHFAFIDKEDYELVSQYGWNLHKDTNTMYAVSNNGSSIKMHRLIANPINDQVVDHIDRNGLNNRKSNLRAVDKYINNRNMNIRKDNKTGVIGVYFSKANNQWRAKWYDEYGKMRQKAFSVKKYGYEESRQMAINYRLQMMKQNEYLYDKDMYGEGSETIENDNKCNSDKENKVS